MYNTVYSIRINLPFVLLSGEAELNAVKRQQTYNYYNYYNHFSHKLLVDVLDVGSIGI